MWPTDAGSGAESIRARPAGGTRGIGTTRVLGDVGAKGGDWAKLFVFALFFIVLMAILVLQLIPQVLQGALLDGDGYMRLLRAEQLAEGGAWYDGTSPGSNAPYGESLHWTRPLDVLLVALAAPFAPFMGWREGLFLAGVVVSPLLFFATCVAVAWSAAPFTGGRLQPLTMLAVLAQPGLVAFGLPGRPDHHALILLLFALMLGFQVRAFQAGEEGRAPARIAGALAGAGVWVSVEFMLPLAVLLVVQGLLWAAGRSGTKQPRAFGEGLLALLVAGLLLEHPPSGVLAVEYDRISIPHVVVGLLVVAFWHGPTRLPGLARERSPEPTDETERPSRRDTAVRLGAGIVAALAGGLLVRILFPPFFHGPWVEVDPVLASVWLNRVEELQPILMPRDGRGVARGLAYLGQVVVVLPALVVLIRRSPNPVARSRWLLLTLLAVFVPMALWQVRWVTYAAVVNAFVIGELVLRVRHRVTRDDRPLASTALRVLVSGALLVGPLFAGIAVEAAVVADGEDRIERPAGCFVTDLVREVGALPLEEEAPIVVAHIDRGPELLYRTRARVLATPYHRNSDGVLDAYRLLGSLREDEAMDIVRARGISGILLCPDVDGAFFPTRREGKATLYTRLVEGEGPPWVEEVPIGGAGGYRLFRVRATSSR